MKGKFSYKTIPGRVRRTRLLNKIIDENANKLLGATQNIRKITERELKVQVDTTNEFFGKLRTAFKLLTPAEVEAIQRYANVENFSELRGALNQLSSALEKADSATPEGWEHDHTTMIPINQALSFTIVVLVETIQQMESGKRFKETKIGGNTAIVDKSTQALKRLTDELRQLRFLSEKIGNTWITGTSPKTLASMIKDDKGQIDITSLKVKDLSFKDGTVATISTTLTEQHAVKSSKQKVIGGARQRLLGGRLNITELSDKLSAQFAEELIREIKQIGVGNIAGSKTLNSARGKHISALHRGKTPKKEKSTSRTRKNYKVGKVKAPQRISKYILKETNADIKRAAALLATKIASANKSRKKSRETGDRQRQLNILRNKINARLGAAVRRNMGRPALINQTGRFSDSVTLLSLVQRGENQVAGDYSYLLDPYATFENKGEKQWPAGYNPNPLIKKSIRELGGEIAEEKFSFYLRRV